MGKEKELKLRAISLYHETWVKMQLNMKLSKLETITAKLYGWL